MDMQNVTNEFILEFLRDFKSDVNRRFESVHREIAELRDMIKEDRVKLDKLYETRNRVAVTFSRAFVGMSLVFSALVSGFVSLFVSNK